MIFYGIAAIFPLLCWFSYDRLVIRRNLQDKNTQGLQKQLLFVAVLPMFLLFVLRYKSVGVDTIGYVKFFEQEIRSFSFQDLLLKDVLRVEVGYCLYVKIISLFTTNYTIFFLINGIVIFGTLWRFSIKYTKNPFVFFFLFMTLGTYSFVETGLRQALAMMICLWSVDFIKDKKLIRFLLLVFLAYLFHKSAMIFVIMYPLSLIKKFDWMIVTYLVISALLFLSFGLFQNFFNELLGYNYAIEETGNGEIFMVFLFLMLASSMFIMKGITNEQVENIIIHLSLMTIVFWIARLVSRTAERISYYFIVGLYAYFSHAVHFGKDRLSSVLKWILIIGCFALFLYRSNGISYMFFWEGM